MRFFRPAVLALAATSVSANSLSLKPRTPPPVDICANVNVHLILSVPLLGNVDYGLIQLCLCVSALPLFITTNLVAIAAVLVHGDAAVIAALTALINAAGDHETCYYPEHAIPICSEDNPCDFDCDDGFTPCPEHNPTECKCKYPKTVCNGHCGYYPHCASQKAKRDAPWRDEACPHGWSACGVWGSNGLDYECVDTRKDLWSCGGCGIPLLSADPTGVDCTAIAGAHDVACISGRCTVERCKEGFEVSADRSTCVPNTRTRPHHNPSFVNNGAY